MEMVLEALNVLEGERQIGFGVIGMIPFRAVRAWAEHRRLDHELTDMLIAVIHRLDVARAKREAAERALKEKR